MEAGYPVIIVDQAFPGIASYIESIEQEVVFLFDEFDKTFGSNHDSDPQSTFLSLFDGTSQGKKLFIITCNSLHGLNDYMVNRPGRFHYHFRFGYPTGEEIRQYLTDTGGTDSPFRETSNIKDGSNIMADMATQCYAGNAARGMSLIALHNGGGVGVSKSINGGFGMVLDGSERVDQILKMSMPWDVMVGVARRGWAGNPNSLSTIAEYNKLYEGQDHITLPYLADDSIVHKALEDI